MTRAQLAELRAFLKTLQRKRYSGRVLVEITMTDGDIRRITIADLKKFTGRD